MTKGNVIIYARVSSDEQKEGTSLDVQEERIRRYCVSHDYNIIGVYREDESAKTFNKRPEMQKIIAFIKANHGKVDKLLFLRWDRFSRDIISAAKTLEWFRKKDVEPNSIEDEIDYSSELWPLRVSMHISLAQADNIKRSKATKDGIHGTLMKGKCSNRAPRGYINVRHSKHDCYVTIDPIKGPKITKVFKEVAKGLESPCSIRKRLCNEIPESSFFDMLRNPFYMGKVKVPAYNGEPECLVQGIHEPLVDETTFYTVQDIIDGKRKHETKSSTTINPDLYLRKFLVCPICGRAITGATSRGNGGKYTYYNCGKDAKHLRVRAEKVNEGFARYVGALIPNPTVLELYEEILKDKKGEGNKEREKEIKKLKEELSKYEERINNVNDAFFDHTINAQERESQLNRYNKEQMNLKLRIDRLKIENHKAIEPKLHYAISLIDNLERYFRDGPVGIKIKLLGLMFPEKIEFDGTHYRTEKFAPVLNLIYQQTKKLYGVRGKERGEENSSLQLSTQTRARTEMPCGTGV
jgi:site-specific DNA recombinase